MTLEELLCLSPPLGTLRSFVDNSHERVTLDNSTKRAWKIWRRMRQNQVYFANKHLRKSLGILCKGNIKKLLKSLDSEPPTTRSKVRTNNCVGVVIEFFASWRISFTNGAVNEQSSATSDSSSQMGRTARKFKVRRQPKMNRAVAISEKCLIL